MMFTLDRGSQMTADPLKTRLDLVERAANSKLASSNIANQPDDLSKTSWQLVKFQGGDDTVLTPDDRTNYTIAFNADNSVNVRFDCNRGRSTWKAPEPNQLLFGPLALTRALCPPGSLHDRLVKDWKFVRSYVIKDGHLFLSLFADGGVYEFEPMQQARPATPQ
ncbi:META domain-containing protein [Leptothermofonsia sp. ETS-13]|uniref:META domain-containing protein n=1 Tax=Leptothermofonsia sp. ETS-13 TaxID=3035696 RepID=UPI003B9EBE02